MKVTQAFAPTAIVLPAEADFDAWRVAARTALGAGLRPDEVFWREAGEAADLFAADPLPPGALTPAPTRVPPPHVPRGFIALAQTAILHRNPGRFALLYRLLWRLQREAGLLANAADPDVHRLQALRRAVAHDIHKMRAFVRFREIREADGEMRYLAWFEPEHHILQANAGFFVDRFANMRWSILTPQGSLHWDGTTLREGPPASAADAPAEDATEPLWHAYYAATFNPARLKIGAMLKEMPKKYWHNLPEARLIPGLIAGAQMREAAMVERGRGTDDAPPTSLADVAQGVATCRRCPIGCNGTNAVAGEGPASAPLMIVGEQPGDREEEAGRPFIGPAGQVLRQHLTATGFDADQAWITNAVKHFKFTPTGKRRLHASPTAGEIDTCRWWLDAERQLIRPQLTVALGASAARGLLGKTVSVQRERGKPMGLPDGGELWVTVHPSYLLRLREAAREAETARFADDLRAVKARLAELA